MTETHSRGFTESMVTLHFNFVWLLLIHLSLLHSLEMSKASHYFKCIYFRFSFACLQNHSYERLCFWSHHWCKTFCHEVFNSLSIRLTLLSVHVMTPVRKEKPVICLLFTTTFNRKLHLITIFGEQETIWFVRLVAFFILRTFLNHFLWQTVQKSNFYIRAGGQVQFNSFRAHKTSKDAFFYYADVIYVFYECYHCSVSRFFCNVYSHVSTVGSEIDFL